jgi:hypothetical protein
MNRMLAGAGVANQKDKGMDARKTAKRPSALVFRSGKPAPIPKGLHHSAQGCEARATLGKQTTVSSTLQRVESIPQISFVKFQFISPQERAKLVLK